MGISREAYLERLREDLSRWAAQGRIPRDAVEALLTDAAGHWQAPGTDAPPPAAPEPEAGNRRMVSLLFLLAGVLLAAGVLSFIAANWEEMSRLARLALIVGGLWASGLLAVWLRERASRRFAEGMFLLTAVMFGGAMVLIAQMYHIHGDLPRFLLTWSLGALALSVLMASQVAGVLGLLLGLGWSFASVGVRLTDFGHALAEGVGVHWPFLLVLVLAALLATVHRWRWLARASVFAALAWAWQSLFALAPATLSDQHHVLLTLPLVGLLAALTGVLLRQSERPQLFAPSLVWQGGLFICLGVLGPMVPDLFNTIFLPRAQLPSGEISMASRWLFHGAVILILGVVLTGLGLRRLQRWEAAPPVLLVTWFLLLAQKEVIDVTLYRLLVSKWVVSGMALILSIWLMGLGLVHEVRAAWWLGLALFGITVFVLYVITIGSLLGTAGFFLGAGLLLLALAVGAWRFLRWVERHDGSTPEEGAA